MSSSKYVRYPFLLVCLIVFLSVYPVHAANFIPVVSSGDTQDANPGDGLCADSGGICSLRAAIEEANALAGPDTITLPAGVFTLTSGSQLDISSDITIDGVGPEATIIQANALPNTATYRVLAVTNTSHVTLRELKIRNGVCAGACSLIPIYGAGIYNLGTLLIDHVTISDNIATTYASVGGGIFNSGTLIVQNQSLIGGAEHGNIGAGDGGGIYSSGSVTIDNSTVSANKAVNEGSGGGGIFNDGGTLIVQNGSVIGGIGAGNSVGYPAGGGGIANIRGGTTIIDASIVSANISGYLGGGITNDSTLIVRNHSIIGGIGAGNIAPDGGGIMNYGTTTIDASTVSANVSTGNANDGFGGGGIFNVSVLTIRNGSVIGGMGAGNSANYGGGIFNWAGSTVTITESHIIENSAVADGGGIFNRVGGTIYLTSSCMVGNSHTAFYNADVTGQTATGNWWGAADGPSGVFTGHGDSVTANIDFSGFLTTAPSGCPTIYTVNTDTTPPSASPTASPAANGAGWNNSDVTVSWNWTDNAGGSGIDLANCTTSSTSSGEGSAIVLTATCKDLAGNTGSASWTVKVDKTAPSLHPVVNPNPVYLNGTASITSGATDSGSGIASESCGALVTSSVGTKTVTCTTTDNAGNSASATVTYAVIYHFTGFMQPINDPAYPQQCGSPCPVSIFRGGTVPTKFQLTDANGNLVQSASLPIWITPVKGGPTSAPIDESVYSDPVSSGIAYKWATDHYQYNWGAKDFQAGYYYRIGVQLDDGQTYVVYVGLR